MEIYCDVFYHFEVCLSIQAAAMTKIHPTVLIISSAFAELQCSEGILFHRFLFHSYGSYVILNNAT